MIKLHRLNNSEFVLNADLVETMEKTPDTVITLTTGKKLMVRDQLEDVISSIIKYRQLCNETVRVVHEEKSTLESPYAEE